MPEALVTCCGGGDSDTSLASSTLDLPAQHLNTTLKRPRPKRKKRSYFFKATKWAE